jgi:radical SAM enzyme (TIGR01210 family)
MDQRVRPGDIPNQIRHALERLPGGSTVKLYNSGNFFDSGAIPPSDLPEIARLLHPFRRVVVENHPKLCDDRCRDFANLLSGQFEIAMGLESVNPAVVRSLNKRMSLQEFEQAAHFLRSHEIDLRTFILLNPPYQDPAQDCHWAIESVRFAVQCGVTTCAIIPVRPGNGMIEILQGEGLFYPTTLTRLEGALASILRELPAWLEAQVLADTWDLETFSNCDRCRTRRIENIHSMNRTQSALPAYECTCTDGEAIVA